MVRLSEKRTVSVILDRRLRDLVAALLQQLEGVRGEHVVGVITGPAGAQPNSGRFGLAIIPKDGDGLEVVKWNLDTLEANQLLAAEGICPA